MNQILDPILNPEFLDKFSFLKYFLISVSVLAYLIIWYANKKMDNVLGPKIEKNVHFYSQKAVETVKFEKAWLKIKKRIKKNIESEGKMAVVEADELLGKALERSGYPGETIEEKIEKLKNETDLNKLGQIRQIRHNIVDDEKYSLPLDQADTILDQYEQVFKDIGALE